MRVAVIDVGANTARLLVADVLNGVTRTVRETRAPIRLGDEIERRGAISERKLDEVATAVADAVTTARAIGVDDIAVLVTPEPHLGEVRAVRPTREELASSPSIYRRRY